MHRKIQSGDEANTRTRVIPVLQEQLRVSAEQVDTASIKIRKEVTEKHIDLETFLHSEDVQVQHVKIDQPVAVAPPAIRYEGDTMIVSVVREELVVQKRLVLDKEIHISKRVIEKQVQEPFVLKKEHVHITKEQPESDR
jgi:uncharacterized protein (TIGR02271 family)